VEPPHGLLPVGAFVDHKAVSFLAQALLARYLSRDIHEVADQCLLLLLHVTDAAKGSLWDDEYVSRGLGRDVVEGDGSVILENLLGRNAAVDDLGKDGVFGIDLQCGRCGPRLVTHAAPLWVARTRGKEEGSGLGQ
jgi:hypothetical protein